MFMVIQALKAGYLVLNVSLFAKCSDLTELTFIGLKFLVAQNCTLGDVKGFSCTELDTRGCEVFLVSQN
jgi:hypothetical protein